MQGSKPRFDAGLEGSSAMKPLPRVVLETSLGALVVEIDTARAPVTAANFLRYAEAGAYDGGQFHRTVTPENQPDNEVRIGVIQGGARRGAARYAAVALERTSKTGLSHLHGTISMARTGADTATDQFFLCVGDQPELDFGGRRNPDGQGFAAFGRLVEGWLVLKRIQMAPAEGQALRPPVVIARARRWR
ncbi:MAG: peptidylprolyl isomerase [Bryobacterales bacterium]|nr:peptidylprolyl isomerase [Bryobacterales bacterium]